MQHPKTVSIYLEPELRRSAQAGEHNFINLMVTVLQRRGFQVSFHDKSPAALLKSRLARGYALCHMSAPPAEKVLCFRRVYQYPFWAIEPMAERWKWRVARTPFDPETLPVKPAEKFYARWQNRLFKDAPQGATRDGFVYVPLQAQLTRQRSFQSMSPVAMIEEVLAQMPKIRVVLGLHPNVGYTEAERAAIEALTRRFPRLSVSDRSAPELLQTCDLVVTQNSSVAFSGFFFGKPAVLFARSDFHHIVANVHALGAAEAFKQSRDLYPDYARYIYWFWQLMSINAGRDNAQDKITQAFARAGWPI